MAKPVAHNRCCASQYPFDPITPSCLLRKRPNDLRTMSGKTARGGTEPLAALVSVAAIAVAISVYAGFASVVVSEGNDGELDRATLDSVWAAASEDGVLDTDSSLEGRLGPRSLPRGHRVAVTVTLVGDDGRLVTVDAASFSVDGKPTNLDPPPEAVTSDRPVPVRVDDGDIRPGRLTVVVWDG